MSANQFPDGLFIGIYKGVKYYTKEGKIQCLFGWMPKTFDSIRSFKINVTKWQKEVL